MRDRSIVAAGRPIRRQSLADSVFETLVEAIVTGRLAPGEELSAVALSAQLQVSRTPVTEALQRLEHDGLVVQTANHPPRVVRLAPQDIDEIYELRLHLEAAAAERAATRIDPAMLAMLRTRAAQIEAARDSMDWATQAIEFDLQFHDTVAQCAGNRRLARDIERYRRLVRSFCRLTGSRENLEAAFGEHLAILDALEARQPAAARKAMTAHIRRRKEVVLRELAAAPEPADRKLLSPTSSE
ncbi:MAG TPA: GntR family transcriptional regulator [Pirellulales bacterium]|jgi:DNA-binding GntR family transcriptional regulator|nr:GntR family transcriptional regulator [Pirellulales bacterium]